MNYMTFENSFTVSDYHPVVGDVVQVWTCGRAGIIAEVVADKKEGYELKYPSNDGTKILYKTVPHWLVFKPVGKKLVEIAALRLLGNSLQDDQAFAAFAATWGEAGALVLAVA